MKFGGSLVTSCRCELVTRHAIVSRGVPRRVQTEPAASNSLTPHAAAMKFQIG